MNKLIIPAAAAVLLAGGAGGAWVYTHRGAPMDNARALEAKGDLRGAQIELRNAVKAEPGNAEARAALARLQLQSGDPIAAEREVRAARELGSSEAVTTPVLAQALLAQQRFADVLREIPATASNPNAASAYLVARGIAQMALQDLPAAAASLEEAQRLAPRSTDALAAGVRLAMLRNDVPQAEALVDRALAIEPKRADTQFLKGQILVAKGNLPAAVAALDEAVAAAPAAAQIRLERAGQLLQTGQNAKARADVDYILSRDPKNVVASYLDMILLVREGKFTEADAILTRLDTVLPRLPRGQFFQALVKANLNQFEAAAEAATRHLARAPQDAEAIRLLAKIEMAARRPDRAVTVLVNAIKAGVNDAETLDMLGRAYAMDGKAPQAAETFQRAADLAPQDPSILTRLATSKLEMGDTKGATSALERSLDMAPKQADAGQALVAAALASGDVDKAQAALDRMRAQAGESEAVAVLDGLIKLSRRDLDGARDAFAEAVKRYPQSVTAAVNLAKLQLLQAKPADAEATLRAVLAKSPAEPQALDVLLGELVRQQRFPDAVTVIRAARAAAPSNLAFVAATATLQVQAKDAPGALATLEEARVAASGTLPTPLMPSQARAQAANGDIETAKATYRRYTTANPLDLEALRSYIDLLVNNNDAPAARQVLADALRNAPGNLGIMQTLILIETRTVSVDAGLAKADELRRNPANMPNASVLKGDTLVALRRFGDGATAFGTEMKTNPSPALAMRQAGALLGGGGPDAAASVLRTWLQQHPDDADVAQMLASLDITARRLPDAETHLKAVLAKRPNDAVALNNLSWVLQQRNSPEALPMARRAYLISPTTESADTLGWILVTSGDAKAAVPLLRQAVAGRPTDPAIRYHLAVALGAAGPKEEAVQILQALVNESAPFDEKAAAQKLLNTLK